MPETSSDRNPLDELAEEFVARYRRGERPALSEYTDKHPSLAGEIRELFPALLMMEDIRPRHDDATVAEPGTSLLAESKNLERLGDYRILREAGRGGMGIVYEAEQESLGRHVALKVLPGRTLLDPQRLSRFRREAKAAARLHHTNIVPVFGVGEDAGLHYYVMQFIAGQGLDQVLAELLRLRKTRGGGPRARIQTPSSLAATLTAADVAQRLLTGEFKPGREEVCAPEGEVGSREGQPPIIPAAVPATSTHVRSPAVDPASSEPSVHLPGQGERAPLSDTGPQYWRSVASIGIQVADALAYAHSLGTLHRDIKPSNLLLDTQGTVWVTDFGLAKTADSADLTRFGDIVGTVRYMAPERFGGRSDLRGDIYGLGITLYEMLTLRPAFEESDHSKLIAQVLGEEPLSPRAANPSVPRDLETIVLKAMAKEPAHRYASAADMAADLKRFAEGRTIRARRVSAAERLWRWSRRNPVVASMAAAIFLLLLVLTCGALFKNAELVTALDVSERANREAKIRLWESLRERARAMRMSRHPGQRIESLRSIAEAMRLPMPPGHSRAELRTEAVAALALPDIVVEHEWQGGLTPGIINVAFDGSLERYARLAQDGTVSVHRSGDGQVVARWKEATEGAWPPNDGNLRFSPDGRYLSVWHPGLKRLVIRRLAGPEPVVFYRNKTAADRDWWSAAFSPDSTTLAHVLPDTRIAIVDLASGQARYLPPTGGRQDLFEFAPDGRRCAISVLRAGKNTVEVRDLATGNVQASLPHPGGASAIAGWSPDGRTLATTCEDSLIRLWDLPSRNEPRTLKGSRANAAGGWHCSFDSAGQMLLSNDWDAVLRLWEPSSGRELLSFPAAGCGHWRVSPSNRLVAYKPGDTTKLNLLRLHGGVEYRTVGVRSRPNAHLPFRVHPDGRLVAVTTEDCTALVDLAAGRELASLPRGVALYWESTGALVTAGPLGLLRWPVHKGTGEQANYRFGPPERLLGSGPMEIWGASADGHTIAIPNLNAGAVVVHRGQADMTVRLAPQQDVRCCAVSPDGRWVATGSHGNTDGFAAKVWEAATGRLEKALPLASMCAVAFSSDGRWLMTGAGGCRLWAVGTWAEGPAVGGAMGCFSPDGKLVAVEDSPGAIRLVETETGKDVVRLEAPEQTRLIPRSFTPDGTTLIAAGVDTQALHIWDLHRLRQGLARLRLDWDAPPYPPAAEPATVPAPLTLTVDTGNVVEIAKADELTAQANRQERAHEYGKALATLRRALAACPDHALANNNLAWLLLTAPKEHRDQKAALPLARKAVALAPSQSTMLNTLGVALYRCGQCAEAVPVLQKSLQAGAGRSDGFDLFFLAMCHARLGDPARARDCYDHAIRWVTERRGKLPAHWVEELKTFQAEAEELVKPKS
jgi:serine/threonine protein kinase/WD40 repeat protein/Flp pilus assembly protein TadD